MNQEKTGEVLLRFRNWKDESTTERPPGLGVKKEKGHGFDGDNGIARIEKISAI